jgi:hypothetical protein
MREAPGKEMNALISYSRNLFVIRIACHILKLKRYALKYQSMHWLAVARGRQRVDDDGWGVIVQSNQWAVVDSGPTHHLPQQSTRSRISTKANQRWLQLLCAYLSSILSASIALHS